MTPQEANTMEAVRIQQPHDCGEQMQLCTFSLAGQLFGVNILHVKEITTDVIITPIFGAPKTVKGYVNIRGQVHLVLNLQQLLGYDRNESAESSQVVLFKPKVGESFGVLVDRIGDVVEVNHTQIENRRRRDEGNFEGREQRQISTDLVIGISRLRDTLLVVLNPGRFLPAIEKN